MISGRHFPPCIATFLLAAVGFTSSGANSPVALVYIPPTDSSAALYITNRAPLLPAPLLKLPIGAIRPTGWLRGQLELEADGLTGHLPEFSKWCKFEGNAWTDPHGEGHSPWEEVPYWLKGYGDLGYVLQNETIIAQAKKWIEAVLASQQPDGWFGPKANRTSLKGKPDLWPHMVMCNVLQSYYEYSGDPRVLQHLNRYFQWLNTLPATAFGEGYWPKLRFGDTLESVYWLYNRTGDVSLLELGKKIHDNMGRWDTGIVNWHNVNIAQGFREPAVYYLQSHDKKYLDQAERNYRQVMDLYGQFPGGGFAGDENCRPGYGDPRQGFETCGIVEFMHSFEMLTRISGNTIWADRTEELAFNSLPAALTPDEKALHYLTCANQVQLDRTNKAPGIQNKGTMFSYSPYQVYRCCQHNVSHGWPYYAEELWLATGDGGLCASLYSASEVTAKVGKGAKVKITETTDYPFDEKITFKIAGPDAERFPIFLRLPAWSHDASLTVNGKPTPFTSKPGAYAVLDREWNDGDVVTLQLPMRVTVRRWENNHDSASVDYGPLTFSLKIGERWNKIMGKEKCPEFEVFPTTPWNYGLLLDPKSPANSFKAVRNPGPLPQQPFLAKDAPIELHAEARAIPAWKTDSQGLVEPLQASPVKSDEPITNITLIPMGAARLRISAFPVIGTGPDAHAWTPPTPR